LGLPLVSIRPGIVSRIGGEIPVTPCEGRIQGGLEWPGSMARASQPQVTAMATITGVGRGAWSDKASGHGCPRWLRSQLLARAALWRQIVARRRQPRVTAMGQSDPLTRTQHGQGSVRRQRFGVDPPGLGRVGDECSFLAWGLRHQDPICRPIRVLVARARSESSTTGPRR